jgi:hypothetical protein
MDFRKSIEAIIETHEVWIIRRSHTKETKLCKECADQAPMLTPEEVAELSGISVRAVYRQVEAGNVHFSEAAGGSLLLCCASFMK